MSDQDKKPAFSLKRAFMAAIAGGVLYLLLSSNGPPKQPEPKNLAYTDMLREAEEGRIKEVVIKNGFISGSLPGGATFRTYAPQDPGLYDILRKNKVTVTVMPPEPPNLFVNLLMSLIPVGVFIGAYFLLMRMQMNSLNARGGGLLGNRSKAKLLASDAEKKVTFADVAGVDEAKHDLQEIVDFLKAPAKFTAMGAKIPRGALLSGPPGTGKTLLARAVAGEAGVPFYSISGSDFVELFVGMGASRVREMFAEAKKNAPCIIFIDEIDAVGRQRGSGMGGGHDEREQTLNQMLVEMDGFEGGEGVIIIAATNRPDVLDPALLRPGRFDRQVVVPLPDVAGREHILKVHARKVPLAADVDLKKVARGTPGFSGADLANLVNEAALAAVKKGRPAVTMADFESARDKIMMGAERRTMAMTGEEKKLTAYHEAGHALVSLNMAGSDPLHKVTIIPRGNALGLTMSLPEGDRVSLNHEQMTAHLAIAFGGRVAEEIIFGKDKVTSGASGDIGMATTIARAMVKEWGMSEKVGFVRHAPGKQDSPFVKTVSEETAKLIDEEVRRLTGEGEDAARKILTRKLGDLHALANALLEHETLTGEDVAKILKGEKIVRKEEAPARPQPPRQPA